MKNSTLALLLPLLLSGCFDQSAAAARPPSARGLFQTASAPKPLPKKTELAAFAAGCFWGVEAEFRKEPGVVATAVGYSGGHTKNPTYEQVCDGKTGHAETVQVEYDPTRVSYAQLLDLFWSLHDPTTLNRQGPDEGEQYRSVIFYTSPAQKKEAEASKVAEQKSLQAPIVTQIVPAAEFTKAEGYHQQYVEKGGRASCHFRRKKKAEVVVSKEDLRAKLTPLQYQCTQEDGTETPFQNEYWDNHRDGIYVDVVSGEPLFSSIDKYDSGSGWPSFTQPLKKENIVTKKDTKLFMERTEVRSKKGNSHLGHVFDDGPGPTGLRYCMNSASLKFIPLEEMEKQGYAEFLPLFKNKKK